MTNVTAGGTTATTGGSNNATGSGGTACSGTSKAPTSVSYLIDTMRLVYFLESIVSTDVLHVSNQ